MGIPLLGNGGSLGSEIENVGCVVFVFRDTFCVVDVLQSQLPSPVTHLVNTVKQRYLPDTAKYAITIPINKSNTPPRINVSPNYAASTKAETGFAGTAAAMRFITFIIKMKKNVRKNIL